MRRYEMLYKMLDNFLDLVDEGLCQLFNIHSGYQFNYDKENEKWWYSCRYCGSKRGVESI